MNSLKDEEIFFSVFAIQCRTNISNIGSDLICFFFHILFCSNSSIKQTVLIDQIFNEKQQKKYFNLN